MKKIILLIMAIAFESFAAYFDIGAGDGTGLISVKGEDLSTGALVGNNKGCDDDCLVPSIEYGARIGTPLTQSLIIAGEFDGFSNLLVQDGKYAVFNSFMVGPSVIFYPAKHFQVSGSLGFAWTDNRTNSGAVDVENGQGVGFSLSAAFDTGINNGALIGAKIYGTSVKLEDSDDISASVGASIFVRFVHKK